MNRRIDSKWLKIPNRPLHLYPLLHLYICWWVCVKLLQSCPILCDLVDCSPPSSSVHSILQARILDWVAMPSSRKSSWPSNWTHISCGVYTSEPLGKPLYIHIYAHICISAVMQLCLTLCQPMDCSTPALPVHHQTLGLAQTHVHWVSDAIQPSHLLSSQSPPAFNLSQHQGLFQMCQFFASGGQSIVVSTSTSVLPVNTQDWSPLGWSGWLSLQSKGLSRVSSNSWIQKHQFFSAQLSL